MKTAPVMVQLPLLLLSLYYVVYYSTTLSFSLFWSHAIKMYSQPLPHHYYKSQLIFMGDIITIFIQSEPREYFLPFPLLRAFHLPKKNQI